MILNKTKNKIISEKEKYCKNIFSWGWGLMFSRKKSIVMVFGKEKRISLHSWFVFYPIEVLVLDSDKRIVEIKRDFKPFSCWKAEKKGEYVVELGWKGDYEEGDKLDFH